MPRDTESTEQRANTPGRHRFWSAASAAPCQRLGGSLTADVAIVGGGLTALSTAYHLKCIEPSLQVAILERDVVGAGSSGINSGQCASRIGPPIETQVQRHGLEQATRLYRYSLTAVERVCELIARTGIECEARSGQQWEVALNPLHVRLLQKRHQLYQTIQAPVSWLAAAEVKASMPGLAMVHSALSHPVVQLNPAQLCQGLKNAALASGVSIYEHSEVTRITSGTVPTLLCNGHEVRANRVLVATDGFVSEVGLLARHVFPICIHAIGTRHLTPREAGDVQWSSDISIFDARHMFNFLRHTADGRVLVGGEFRYGSGIRPGSGSTVCARRLHASLAKFFPALAAVSTEVQWRGVAGCTLEGWPIARKISREGNIFYAGAWNGHGVALSVAVGADISRWLLAEDAAYDVAHHIPWAAVHTSTLPAKWLVDIGVPLYLSTLRATDRISFVFQPSVKGEQHVHGG